MELEQGAFISEACTSEVGVPICAECEWCGIGEYMKTKCNGFGMSNQSHCSPCLRCDHGEYITGCDGTGLNDSGRTCTVCETCEPGMLSGCDGMGVTPSGMGCQECTNDCGPGAYWYDACECRDCERCDLGSHIISCSGENNKTCEKCAPCLDGEYIQEQCIGDIQSQRQCTACIACGDGEVMTNGCDGTQLSNHRECVEAARCGIDEKIETYGGTRTFSNCTSCSSCTQDFEFRTKRCAGDSIYDTHECAPCVCPTLSVDVGLIIPYGQECSGDIPNHACVQKLSVNDMSTVMRGMGLICTLTVVSSRRNYVGTRVEFRNALIHSHPMPLIQSIVLNITDKSSVLHMEDLQYLSFWTVYASTGDAIDAVKHFNMSLFNLQFGQFYWTLVVPPVIYNAVEPVLQTSTPTPVNVIESVVVVVDIVVTTTTTQVWAPTTLEAFEEKFSGVLEVNPTDVVLTVIPSVGRRLLVSDTTMSFNTTISDSALVSSFLLLANQSVDSLQVEFSDVEPGIHISYISIYNPITMVTIVTDYRESVVPLTDDTMQLGLIIGLIVGITFCLGICARECYFL